MKIGFAERGSKPPYVEILFEYTYEILASGEVQIEETLPEEREAAIGAANRQHQAFMELGLESGVTKPSKSGKTIIFAQPYEGRHDLSGLPWVAERQLKSAGLLPA